MIMNNDLCSSPVGDKMFKNLFVRTYLDSFNAMNDVKHECKCNENNKITKDDSDEYLLTKDIVKVFSSSSSHSNSEIAAMIMESKMKILSTSKREYSETGLILISYDTEIKPCFENDPLEGTVYIRHNGSCIGDEKSIGSGVGIFMLKKDNETYLFYHLFGSKNETDDEFLDRMESYMMEVYNTCYSSYTIVDTFFASECLDVEPGKVSITSCAFAIC